LSLAFARDGWWAQVISPYPGPPGKTYHTAATIGGVMFVLGGDSSSTTSLIGWVPETNGWSPYPGTTLTNLFASDMDDVGGMLIVFGGSSSGGYLNNIYAIHPSNITGGWIPISSDSSIPQRNGHTITELGGLMYVFGGWDSTQYFADLWSFDTSVLYNGGTATTWKKYSSTGPSPRNSHSMMADGGKLWLFGGFFHDISTGTNVNCLSPAYGCTWYNDLWSYSVKDDKWTQLKPSNPPPKRSAHSAELIGDRMIVFGGQASDTLPLNDLWSYSITRNEWTQLKPSNSIPLARFTHSSSIIGSTMFIYGGVPYYGAPAYDDLWQFTLNVEQTTSCSSETELDALTGAMVFNIFVIAIVGAFTYLSHRRLKGPTTELHSNITDEAL